MYFHKLFFEFKSNLSTKIQYLCFIKPVLGTDFLFITGEFCVYILETNLCDIFLVAV